MPYERIEASFEDGTPIKLIKLPVGKLWYAAGPVVVYIGSANCSTPESTFAVMCCDEKEQVHKHINLRKECVKWLGGHWLGTVQAELLLALSEHVITPVKCLHDQEEEGEYFEEIQRIRDGLLGAINSGEIDTMEKFRKELGLAISSSAYVKDFDLGLTALKYEQEGKREVEGAVIRSMYDRLYRDLEKCQTKLRLPRSQPK